jgi:hypothetical protein
MSDCYRVNRCEDCDMWDCKEGCMDRTDDEENEVME